MSFFSDFKTIITGDASINALITGGIKLSHLPEDFDIKKTWMAWDYRLSEQNNTLDGNDAYSTYSITMTITTTDTVILNNLTDLIVNYLNNKTTSNFPDIWMITDSKLTTLSKPSNAYQNALEFGAIYVGT
jgi:hypothetical protein